MCLNQIKHNKQRNLFHTIVLLCAMASMMGAVGWFLAGQNGLIFLSALTLSGLIFSPQIPAHYIMKLYRARPVETYELPGLYHILKNLTMNARLSRVPRLYYSPSPILNAFAAGTKDDPAICLTRGLLDHLNTEQMAGILGHEIAHIKNKDTMVMSVAAIFGRTIRCFSSMGLFLIFFAMPFILAGIIQISFSALLLIVLAPWVSALLELRLSRTREFEADLGSALFVGSPYPLATALQRLEKLQQNPWTRFLQANPVKPPQLLSSHPDTRERIRRLMSYAQQPPNKIRGIFPGTSPWPVHNR